MHRTISAGVTAAVLVAAASGGPKLEEGRPFPELVLPSMIDGRPMSVADYRGRKVILQVFASW